MPPRSIVAGRARAQRRPVALHSLIAEASVSRPSKIRFSTTTGRQLDHMRQARNRAARHDQQRFTAPCARASACRLRSMAPAMASVPPLIKASLVLVGKSRTSPVGTFRPAVPLSRARYIKPKPGRIKPPRKWPLGVHGIHRHSRPHHHGQHWRRVHRMGCMQGMLTRPNDGRPTVRTQALRVLVAVEHTTSLLA
jgi:hypothetical protein